MRTSNSNFNLNYILGIIVLVFLIYSIFFYLRLTKNIILSPIPIIMVIASILIYLINRDIVDTAKQTRNIESAKTDFVSLASHQLCTPLSAISWYSEMLLTGDAGELNKEQRKYLETIYRSTKRMVVLVNALLNVSRIDLGTFSIEPETTDIRKIADTVLEELPPLMKKKQLNITRHYDEIPEFSADPNLMKIIFQNILSNSIKYTPEGGNIEVTIEKKGRKLRIIIRDSGCGIPPEQQSRVFQKLFRADNVRRLETDGTGLGLYIVKAIIDYSGGNIWFKSDVGKGTAFYIEFPISGMNKKVGTKRLG